MVVLTEIANKLQNVLNGVDSETSGFGHLSNYEFMVATEGFHLDKINDNATGKNFIPVFVSSMGGEYNPVPNLEEANFNIPITIYYPVRFKDDFYLLGEYLIKYFVGTQLNYGTHSGVCLSNISVAQYGEIQSIDTQQFVEWVGSLYQRTLNVKELFMSMTFTLYLSSVKSGFIYGNSIKADLSYVWHQQTLIKTGSVAFFFRDYTKDTSTRIAWTTTANITNYTARNCQVGDNCYNEEGTVVGTIGSLYFSQYTSTKTISNVVFDSGSIQTNSDPNGQQVLDTTEGDGLPTATSYSSSLKMYLDLSVANQKQLFGLILDGRTQDIQMNMVFDMGYNLFYEKSCYIQSVILPMNKGEVLSLTLTFNKRADI